MRESAVSKEVIDGFLQGPSWAQYDPELGYILGTYLPQDGIDNSATISTVQANGARTSFMYVGKKCRINTYGDSFTQCHQVSDGETWQEYLAGHLGEPIRNFGMGGYGVYQAYRRMNREERTDRGTQYVIFYIWGDDHIRSLLRCRHAIIFRWWNDQGGRAFHNNFWPNVEHCRNRPGEPDGHVSFGGHDAGVARGAGPDFSVRRGGRNSQGGCRAFLWPKADSAL